MELPNDLFTEVLVRLPLKDILISRCVCRTWNILISNPYFSSYYAKNSPYTSIFITQAFSKLKSLSLLQFSANEELSLYSRYISIKPKVPRVVDINSDPWVTIIGSCDGSLFLLHTSVYLDDRVIDKIYLCNPLFERCVKIAEDIGNSQWGVSKYEVGYIPSTNSYKLLRFGYDGGRVKEAKIFTVGVDKDWRIVEDPFTFLESWSQGVCFNGAYHWVAYSENLVNIFTFDLLEEKCSGIPNPPGLLLFSLPKVSVTILNGRLSLVDCSDGFQMNIWTMDKYGVAESWFRNIILLKHWFPYSKYFYLKNFLPIAVLPNGNIIFLETESGSLYFFSLEEKQCSQIKLRGVDHQLAIVMADAFEPRFYSLRK
ncbi:hypothetical protein DH2020_005832 [Rehmannia glutinosa]|uniref:F-box domain-containing protein n=1 Tax=Rehmannia glutinosa TaxID=99300 RepID=A0ABR0XHP2_REHGL